jgi:hypothetical protein
LAGGGGGVFNILFKLLTASQDRVPKSMNSSTQILSTTGGGGGGGGVGFILKLLRAPFSFFFLFHCCRPDSSSLIFIMTKLIISLFFLFLVPLSIFLLPFISFIYSNPIYVCFYMFIASCTFGFNGREQITLKTFSSYR